MFFFPSGRSVERQVRHGLASGGAVRQSTWGTVDEVPVPRKMSSMGSAVWNDARSRDPMVVQYSSGARSRNQVVVVAHSRPSFQAFSPAQRRRQTVTERWISRVISAPHVLHSSGLLRLLSRGGCGV